jgi:hypothetical protein
MSYADLPGAGEDGSLPWAKGRLCPIPEPGLALRVPSKQRVEIKRRDLKMGYVHDTQMSVVIPPCDMQFVTGTWTDAVAASQWTKNKAAAAETAAIRIPIAGLFQNAAGLKGALVKSIDVWYEITTLAATAITATIYKLSAPADNTAPAAPAQQSFTYDGGHDTAAKRYAIQKHKMTLTLNAPIWLADSDVLFVELSVNAGTSTIYMQKEARANFTLRM